MTSPSTAIDQQRLKVISTSIIEKFDQIMECLNISLKKQNNMYVGQCPVHGGDKFNALNIYCEGDTYVGNWKCRTNECEKHFVGSVIGFIRGVLSHNKFGWSGPGDQMVSFKETLKFISSCLKEDYESIDIDMVSLEKSRNVASAKILNRGSRKVTEGQTRAEIRAYLKIPSEYFINRGFNANILDKYDVGLCSDPKQEGYGRIVVPIYDDRHKYIIGITSRSQFDRCEKCKTWHDHKGYCPRPEEAYKNSKWKHTAGLKKEEHLYNYWYAREHIRENKVVVLTESPGNVWKLEEAGITTGLAVFGAKFSDGQKYLLNQSGAMTIIVAMDNDEAGQRCAADIDTGCKKIYNIHNFVPTANDIGDMTIPEIQKTLLPLYLSCVKELT